MGLTIHYNYQTNRKISLKKAREISTDMWNYALNLKDKGALKEVSDLFYVTKEEIEIIRNLPHEERSKHELGWAVIQCTEHVQKKVSLGKNRYGKHVYKTLYKEVYPEEGWIFTTWPGEGSEEANFGLMRFPSEITLTENIHDFSVVEPIKELKIKTGYSGWRWGSFCKTQYASKFGLAHFAQCHIAVCAMLENIYKMDSLNTVVHDEGEFWEKKDIPALINEVGQWNQMISAFAGAFLDASSRPEFKDSRLYAPILEHPDFEVLETEGLKNMDRKYLDNTVDIISDILKLKEVESKLPKD